MITLLPVHTFSQLDEYSQRLLANKMFQTVRDGNELAPILFALKMALLEIMAAAADRRQDRVDSRVRGMQQQQQPLNSSPSDSLLKPSEKPALSVHVPLHLATENARPLLLRRKTGANERLLLTDSPTVTHEQLQPRADESSAMPIVAERHLGSSDSFLSGRIENRLLRIEGWAASLDSKIDSSMKEIEDRSARRQEEMFEKMQASLQAYMSRPFDSRSVSSDE